MFTNADGVWLIVETDVVASAEISAQDHVPVVKVENLEGVVYGCIA